MPFFSSPVESPRKMHAHPLAGALVVFLAACLLYLPSLSRSPFSSRGEAREAVVVFNMIEQGNFVLPLRNGSDIPSKPPLFHWLGSFFAMIGAGSEEFAIRLPSGLAAALGIAVMFLFVALRSETLVGNKAFFTALVLGTCSEWARYASVARVDMLFAVWCTIATLLLFSTVQRWATDAPAGAECAGASLAMALATLSKGPAGIAFPCTVVFIYSLLFVPIRKWRFLSAAACVLGAAALAGIWYFAAWRIGGERFLDVHLMRENFARIVGAKSYMTGHQSPFYITLPLLLLGFMPWTVFMPVVCAAVWAKRKALRLIDDPFLLLCLIWVLFYVVFFSLTSSKRSVYLLPAYPPLAYLMALVCSRALGPVAEFKRSRIFAMVCLSVFSVLLFGASAIGLFYSPRLLELIPGLGRLSAGVHSQVTLVLTLLSSHPLISGAIALSALLLIRAVVDLKNSVIETAVVATSMAVAVLTVLVNYVMLPPVSLNNSPIRFIREALSKVPEGQPLYEFRKEMYSAIFYGKRNLPYTQDLPAGTDRGYAYVLATGDDLPVIKEQAAESEVLLISKNAAFQGKQPIVLLKAKPKAVLSGAPAGASRDSDEE